MPKLSNHCILIFECHLQLLNNPVENISGIFRTKSYTLLMNKLSFTTLISFLITSPSPEGLAGALWAVQGWSLNHLRALIGWRPVAFSPIQYFSPSPVQQWWPCFPVPLGQLAETEEKEKAMVMTKDEKHILNHLLQKSWGLFYLLQLLNPSVECFSEWVHFSVHLLSAIITNTSTG